MNTEAEVFLRTHHQTEAVIGLRFPLGYFNIYRRQVPTENYYIASLKNPLANLCSTLPIKVW